MPLSGHHHASAGRTGAGRDTGRRDGRRWPRPPRRDPFRAAPDTGRSRIRSLAGRAPGTGVPVAPCTDPHVGRPHRTAVRNDHVRQRARLAVPAGGTAAPAGSGRAHRARRRAAGDHRGPRERHRGRPDSRTDLRRRPRPDLDPEGPRRAAAKRRRCHVLHGGPPDRTPSGAGRAGHRGRDATVLALAQPRRVARHPSRAGDAGRDHRRPRPHRQRPARRRPLLPRTRRVLVAGHAVRRRDPRPAAAGLVDRSSRLEPSGRRRGRRDGAEEHPQRCDRAAARRWWEPRPDRRRAGTAAALADVAGLHVRLPLPSTGRQRAGSHSSHAALGCARPTTRPVRCPSRSET